MLFVKHIQTQTHSHEDMFLQTHRAGVEWSRAPFEKSLSSQTRNLSSSIPSPVGFANMMSKKSFWELNSQQFYVLETEPGGICASGLSRWQLNSQQILRLNGWFTLTNSVLWGRMFISHLGSHRGPHMCMVLRREWAFRKKRRLCRKNTQKTTWRQNLG